MKTLVTLCFMALLGLVLVEGRRGPCGCRRMFDFCANDYKTYHSICEYKCKHPSAPFQNWYILYYGPCRGQSTEAGMETTITTDLPVTSFKSNKDTVLSAESSFESTRGDSIEGDISKESSIPGYVWEPSTGSSYKVHTAAADWRSAKATCEAEGGYLAIINSRAESNFLKDLFNQNSMSMITGTEDRFKYYASLGFRKLDDGQWQTIQGQSIAEAGFDEWSDGEPNNWRGIEDCGTMFWNGLLNDVPCETYLYPFICEA